MRATPKAPDRKLCGRLLLHRARPLTQAGLLHGSSSEAHGSARCDQPQTRIRDRTPISPMTSASCCARSCCARQARFSRALGVVDIVKPLADADIRAEQVRAGWREVSCWRTLRGGVPGAPLSQQRGTPRPSSSGTGGPRSCRTPQVARSRSVDRGVAQSCSPGTTGVTQAGWALARLMPGAVCRAAGRWGRSGRCRVAACAS